MQNGVGDSANVLVDGKPVVNFRRIEWRVGVVRIAVAVEIPGRIDEGVHGVGFSSRGAAAFWTLGVYKFRGRSQRRCAFAGQIWIWRKENRQILVGHLNDAIFFAIDDRDRSAPVSLPRDAPIFQAKDGFFFSEALGFGERRHLFLGEFGGEAGKFTGVD